MLKENNSFCLLIEEAINYEVSVSGFLEEFYQLV